jgi:hypothetical protein
MIELPNVHREAWNGIGPIRRQAGLARRQPIVARRRTRRRARAGAHAQPRDLAIGDVYLTDTSGAERRRRVEPWNRGTVVPREAADGAVEPGGGAAWSSGAA